MLKPPAQLASHATMLEEEIYRQIGVPNSKVSVTMQTLSFKDVTCVEFGILPDQINTSISAQSMRTLRTKLMQLTLQQMNLSLTPSVFGDPFCVEVLGFPGGITMEVELPPYNSNVYFVQPIFNVTLEMSIHQIRGVLAELKKSLEHTLGQALHKGICLDVTNKNGSTINPPVTVQVSLSPDDRNIYEEPQRLKQLAEIIIESSSRNLGLNPSIFGRIKDLELDPYLQSIIPSFAPSSSPTPIPSPSMPPYSQPSNLCEHCSCPDFVTIMNTAFPHRKLMRLPPMAILLQLPTRLHSGKIPLHEKNGNAVATPTFIATSSRP